MNGTPTSVTKRKRKLDTIYDFMADTNQICRTPRKFFTASKMSINRFSRASVYICMLLATISLTLQLTCLLYIVVNFYPSPNILAILSQNTRIKKTSDKTKHQLMLYRLVHNNIHNIFSILFYNIPNKRRYGCTHTMFENTHEMKK